MRFPTFLLLLALIQTVSAASDRSQTSCCPDTKTLTAQFKGQKYITIGKTKWYVNDNIKWLNGKQLPLQNLRFKGASIKGAIRSIDVPILICFYRIDMNEQNDFVISTGPKLNGRIITTGDSWHKETLNSKSCEPDKKYCGCQILSASDIDKMPLFAKTKLYIQDNLFTVASLVGLVFILLFLWRNELTNFFRQKLK